MARPATIQQDEVFAAVHALVAAGTYPNPGNVRVALGNRGSPPVLQRHIGAWYEEFGPELARKAAAKPPASATGALQAELRRLTQQASEEMDAAHAKRTEELDARERDLVEQEAALSGREDSLAAAIARLEERELGQQQLLQEIQASSAAAVKAREEAMAALAAAEAHNQALVQRCEAAEAAADTAAELERRLAVASSERDRHQARAKELTQDRERLQQLVTDRSAEYAKVSAQLAKVEEALGESRTELAQARERLEAARSSLAGAQAEATAIAGERDQLRADLEASQARADEYARAASIAAAEHAAISARCASEQAGQALWAEIGHRLGVIEEATAALLDCERSAAVPNAPDDTTRRDG